MLVFAPPSIDEIKSVINSMKEVSTGHDQLPLFVFKKNFDILGNVLLQMFRKSIAIGVVPTPMKLARVTCIHKAGDHKNVENYWPISVLPVLSKVPERLIQSRVMEQSRVISLFLRCSVWFSGRVFHRGSSARSMYKYL